MSQQRIAIIGGGGAGIAAAWSLARVHDITLFESQPYLGGHAYTHHYQCDGKQVDIDMGVEFFNERLSPNLCAMLKKYGVETFATGLSMKVKFKGDDNFWSNVSNDGQLRDKLNQEFDRFHLDMSQVLSSGEPRYKAMSIEQFLDEKGYSDEFKYQALLPLLTTYSGCDAPSLDYNLIYAAVSFAMSLLSFYSGGYWRKSCGGIDQYIQHISKELGDKVRLSCPVARVSPKGEGVEVTLASGEGLMFDKVVFATHADVTVKMIEHLGQEYQSLLGGFEHVKVRSVLHSDNRLLSKPDIKEYCEFVMPDDFDLTKDRQQYGTLTRINNNLYPYREVKEPLLVSFDPKTPVDEAKIRQQHHWELPKLRPADFARKMQVRQIQGKQNLWFCGTDVSLTGHEGALVSGLIIADMLGADYPFKDDMLANIQFKVIKDIMGVYKRNEKFSAWFNDVIFKVAKTFNLHKEQSHKFVKDMMI